MTRTESACVVSFVTLAFITILGIWAVRRPSPVQRITEAIAAGPTNRLEDYMLTWHKLSNGYALDIDITNAVGAAQDSANSFTFFYGHTGKLFRVRIVPEPAPQ